ncbi:MAG: alpha/beta hydrolase [Chloroflexi bacterium]|nr:alpha/beta hydrolase [Chloroflexota bacterium]
MPTINIQEKKLHYEEFGEGQPLILIHAALLDSRMWEKNVPTLAANYRVITYDLSGYGMSLFAEDRRVDHPGDLAALLRALGIDRAHILGTSMGGEIALRFALQSPAMVRSLILVGAGLEGYDYPEEAFAWWDGFVAAMRAGDFEQARQIFMRNGFDSASAPLTSDERAGLQTILKDYSMRHYLDDTLLWKGYDRAAAQQLGEIACPCLILVGDGDSAVNQDIGRFMAEHLPRAVFRTIPGAGHLPNWQQPKAFSAAVTAFLAGEGIAT